MISKQELGARLEHVLTVPLSPETREAQLAVIDDALNNLGGGIEPAPSWLRRRALVLASGLVMTFGTAGVSLAAEGALPGEALFPVKRVTETVRSWFDGNVIADHRLDELEATIARGASDIDDRLRDARNAVEDLAPNHQYRMRLAEIEEDLFVPTGEGPERTPGSPDTSPEGLSPGPGDERPADPGRNESGEGGSGDPTFPGGPTDSSRTLTTAGHGEGGAGQEQPQQGGGGAAIDDAPADTTQTQTTVRDGAGDSDQFGGPGG